MDIIILIITLGAVMGTLNTVCFFIGAKVGQKVARGETIETPNLNPIKAYQEKQEKKAVKEEQDKIEAIMRNIEKYDGTTRGQEDIPR